MSEEKDSWPQPEHYWALREMFKWFGDKAQAQWEALPPGATYWDQMQAAKAKRKR